MVFLAWRETTNAAAAAVEEPVGAARSLGIPLYSTATESEVGGSSGEAGSSGPGADDTARPDDATVAKAGENRSPGIAEHSVTTASVFAVSSGEAVSARLEMRTRPMACVTAVARLAGGARHLKIAKRSTKTESHVLW